jgi:hypothetical protein
VESILLVAFDLLCVVDLVVVDIKVVCFLKLKLTPIKTQAHYMMLFLKINSMRKEENSTPSNLSFVYINVKEIENQSRLQM